MCLLFFFFFSSRRRHTRFKCDWSSDVCSSDLKRTAGITAIYQLDISGNQGGKWYVKIIDGKAEVCQGEVDNPGCTIMMQDSDYVAMATKKLSGSTAFMTGKLRIKGNMDLAMKAANIFR